MKKVTSACDDRHRLRKAVNDRSQAVRSTLVYCYRCTNVGFVNSLTSAAPWIVCKGTFIQDPPSRQTIDFCVCNGLMSPEPGKLIGTKLSFQMNQASICGTMIVEFVLDAMPVNAAFQSALSKRHSDLTPRVMEGRTVTSVAAEFGINKSVVSRAWKAFQTTGTAVRKVGGGRPRTTTAGDDRYIILQAKKADGSQQASLLSNFLQQWGDKCRGLLWPDAFTKGAYSRAVLNAASR
ncbi:uncharacterized protein TNCV_2214401 [Trichonephila clavipes]|nr:uncharacterized protein TNCV_2214401 [Trichonephila clavipes]